MRNLIIYISALTALSPYGQAFKHEAAQLRDLLAYPKYEMNFLNDLPLSSSDAHVVDKRGLENEHEWLKLRLEETRGKLSDGSSERPLAERLQLVPMSLTPPGSDHPAEYLCLMPSTNATTIQTVTSEKTETQEELDPVQSWAAMSHLDGKCLYLQLGWFTYSYCHNSHIRQFREARHNHPHPPGGYEPVEDETFEAYTLGQAQKGFVSPHKRLAPGKVPSEVSNTVSFGRGASSRYLKQQWSDGTTCDKTGKPRKVEIQIHCSMTTSDMIYLVKEMAICSYVVIIHSPHLCSLPGFRTPHIDVRPAGIMCRQVVSDEDFELWEEEIKEAPKREKETLRLPWFQQPLQEEAKRTEPGANADLRGVLGGLDRTLEKLDNEAIFRIFEQALGLPDKKGAKQGEKEVVSVADEEVVFLALMEDDDGNLVLDADVKEKGSKQKMGKGEADHLLGIVKQYIEQKRKDEENDEEGRKKVHDEL